MTAYMIAWVDVTDLDAWKNYAANAGPTVEKFGGKYIVRGGDLTGLENFEDEGKRVVIIQFPDVETAEKWYHSDEYTAVRKLRDTAGHARFMIVDGYDG